MCEVTRHNFKQLFPQIEKSVLNAVFVAIDSEFSGISYNSKLRSTFFDTVEERYSILKQNIEHFVILQFGLSAFHYDRETNQYAADVYNFYLFPHSFGSTESRFLCQASALEFLCQNNFNFNKVMYEGISYLNQDHERHLRALSEKGILIYDVESTLTLRDRKYLQQECSNVAQWVLSAEENECWYIDCTEFRLEYLLHKEIRRRFNNVSTFSEPTKVGVRKLKKQQEGVHTVEDRTAVEDRTVEDRSLEEAVIRSQVGFSDVIKLLISLKKIIIGHNFLLDIMLMYNQFHERLPYSYHEFKKKVNVLFPFTYDTKFISNKMRNVFREPWGENSLDELYSYFTEGKGRFSSMYCPVVHPFESSDIPDKIKDHLHEASWDAYMAGFVFINIAHHLALRNLGREAVPRLLSRTEHLAAVGPYTNLVNVVRSNLIVNFGGKDPPVDQPVLLLTKRQHCESFSLEEATAAMARFGSVDVKALGENKILIAPSSWKCAKHILKASHSKYHVVVYSPLKHSAVLNTVLWAGVLSSGAVCAFYLARSFLGK